MEGQNTNHQSAPLPENGHKKDDLEAASQAMSEEYEEYSRHAGVYTAPVHALRNAFVAILILLLLVVGAAAAYWFLIRNHGADSSAKKTTTTQKTNSDNTSDAVISSKTKHYASSAFMLEFDYPDNWKVSEPAAAGRLTATSPAIALKTADGKTVTGQVVYTARNKQQPLPEFDKGNAVAARESDKIDYTKPSSAQRGSTYLSFLRYATSANSKSIDGIYVTGDVGYQIDQAIPKADFTPVDPVISMTFVKCADSSCSGAGTATGIASSMWDSNTFGKPLKTMFQSLIAN